VARVLPASLWVAMSVAAVPEPVNATNKARSATIIAVDGLWSFRTILPPSPPGYHQRTDVSSEQNQLLVATDSALADFRVDQHAALIRLTQAATGSGISPEPVETFNR